MTDDSNDEQQHVLSGTAPVSYLLMPGSIPQHRAAAHSAPNELLKNRQMSSPLSLGDRESTTNSISEVTTTVNCAQYLSFV